jgi:glutaminyl-tRNA synthetase
VGTLHCSIKHAIEAEVRLYDRLFIDEAGQPQGKNFFEFKNSNFEIVKGFVEPSLVLVLR